MSGKKKALEIIQAPIQMGKLEALGKPREGRRPEKLYLKHQEVCFPHTDFPFSLIFHQLQTFRLFLRNSVNILYMFNLYYSDHLFSSSSTYKITA